MLCKFYIYIISFLFHHFNDFILNYQIFEEFQYQEYFIARSERTQYKYKNGLNIYLLMNVGFLAGAGIFANQIIKL